MFEIWENSKCVAKRTLEEVKEEFHNMKIGETRSLDFDIWIVRVA